jgi:hypothetical protein
MGKLGSLARLKPEKQKARTTGPTRTQAAVVVDTCMFMMDGSH